MSKAFVCIALLAVIALNAGCAILRSNQAAPKMTRGVNLGNALEAPTEGEWGVILEERYFREIARAGFDTVRVPVRWSAHAGAEPPYTIDPVFMERIDWVVDQALRRGLTIVLNMHHYEELATEPDGHCERFLSLWRQIAEHYRSYPPRLVFELLNEPNSALTANKWNDLLFDALLVGRQSNPTRLVVVGPARWNTIEALGELDLPDDPNLIVTFHYYQPFEFTHQGAEWVTGSDAWLGATWDGMQVEQDILRGDLDRALTWAQKHDRPLWLGEFGAYEKAPLDSRLRWTSFVAREAEARGIGWCYWEFCAGFGVYDRETHTWRQSLLEALIPPDK